MSSIRGVKDRRFKFVQLLNSMLEDQKISLKAKGFIGYCLTKKDDWTFHVSHLTNVLKEGETAIYSVINECIKNGYAFRYRTRNEKGQLSAVQFIISDSKFEIQLLMKELESDPNFNNCLPHQENTNVDKPHQEEPHQENPNVDSPGKNDPIYSNTNSSNTEQQQQAAPACDAAASSKKHSSKNQNIEPPPKVHACLEKIDIPIKDKIEITNKHEEHKVKHAILWTETTTQSIRCLVAALKWACIEQPEIEKPKKALDNKRNDYSGYTRNYWASVKNAFITMKRNIRDYQLTEESNYVCIAGEKAFFTDASFVERIENYFDKKNLLVGGFCKFMNQLREDFVKQCA